MYDRYSTAYNMWKGFSHWSSFMMLRDELLGMHITLTGSLVLIFTLSGFLVTNFMEELNPIRSQFSESTSSLLLPVCVLFR
jgi:hypothetical protein